MTHSIDPITRARAMLAHAADIVDGAQAIGADDASALVAYLAAADDALSAHRVDLDAGDPVFALIRRWGAARGLIGAGAAPDTGNMMFRQLAKLTEEVGEIAGAVARGNAAGVRDGIGDAVVVLTLLAEQAGTRIEDCIDAAYAEISDRKGRTVNGVFIKDGEGTA